MNNPRPASRGAFLCFLRIKLSDRTSNRTLHQNTKNHSIEWFLYFADLRAEAKPRIAGEAIPFSLTICNSPRIRQDSRFDNPVRVTKNKTSELYFLYKPQAWYGITRKRVCVSPCGFILYSSAS